MRKAMLIVLLVIVTSTQTYAQMRQMIWPLPVAVTQNSYGFWDQGAPKLFLDFHTDPPTIVEQSSDPFWFANEPISAICNRWGQLQFYSDNHRVWNQSHVLVENIANLHSNIPADRGVFSTVANATIMLPFPGDSLDRFFLLLTMDYSGEGAPPMYLQHSVLDRYGGSSGQGTLMGQGQPLRPLGDVMIQEKMAAVKHANGRDWWIICRKAEDLSWETNSDTILSILFTPNGVDTILYSKAPRSVSSYGNMKTNHGGTILAETCWALDETTTPLTGRSVMYLYKFNRCDGGIVCVDSLVAPGRVEWYSLEFSPNDHMLYVGDGQSMKMVQAQITLDKIVNVEQIVNLPSARFFGQFLMGPDKKIYCKQGSLSGHDNPAAHYLGVIPNPDEPGGACGFDHVGIYLNGHSLFGSGLPNHPNYDLGPLRGSICDSLPDPVIASVPVQALPEVFSVNAYPNPASGTLMLSATGGTLSNLQVFNALGQLQWRLDDASPHQAVFVEDWPVGIYTIVARANSGALSKRQVMIQR